jgi:AcrR family transcriptional regulator
MSPQEKAIRKSEETRARILEAALSLFRKRGFENATMRDIAKEAGVALGAAYYYFRSKDALVMAFYERTQRELSPRLEEVLAGTQGLEERLRAMLEIKLAYFAPNRNLMGALSAHIDPEHPLSPFSEATRTIREQDIQLFERALQTPKTRVPEELQRYLPHLLWLYQMGLLLFWIYDRSPQQKRTALLLTKTLSIVVKLIQFSGFPLLRPVRKLVTDLLAIIYGEGDLAGAEETL